MLISKNPATGAILWQGAPARPEQISQAIHMAREAFPAWARLAWEERYRYLEKFHAIVVHKRESLTEILCQETGKPWWEAWTELGAVLGKLAITKEAFLERSGSTERQQDAVKTITRHKPHGVLVVLGPFNFPLHIPNGHILPALLAGNTVVYKPSELTPMVSEAILQCWNETRLPQGVFTVLQGGGEVGKALVEHSQIDGVLFTGSAHTGCRLHEAFAKAPQKVLALEMGGNNPLVVHEPSDLRATVFYTIQSAYITSGQRCTCARRLILPRNERNELFLQRLIQAVEKIQLGAYTDRPEPFMGPVISVEAANRIQEAYEALLEQGARVLVPMRRENPALAFVTPSLVDVTEIKNRKDEEIFGPLLQVIWVENFEAAIREANNTVYGLSAGLICDDKKRYEQFYQEVRAGLINWNCAITGASSKAPFGGVGSSGNLRPSAYYAADYCSYPVASMESDTLKAPDQLLPGITV